MIKVIEDIFRAGEDISDSVGYETNKVNAIYHPPKDGISGYYVIDFETVCQSLKTAVKRFVRACKKDHELSTNCSDIVHTDSNDFSDWYEWFATANSFPMFKPIDTGGQQVMYEVNDNDLQDSKYASYYLSALLMEVDK